MRKNTHIILHAYTYTQMHADFSSEFSMPFSHLYSIIRLGRLDIHHWSLSLSLSLSLQLTGAVGTIPAAPNTEVTVGGVGRRGAVWPTGFDWLAMAMAGAASDIASSSPGMAAT